MLNGPDIRRLMKDAEFENGLSEDEAIAWDCLKAVIENVLGKHRSENARVLVNDMLNAFDDLNVHMSLKIHFLHQHFDYFEQQLSTESDEHGERFHQISKPFEECYAGKRKDSMLADLWWSISNENTDMEDASLPHKHAKH